ncbi:hypothetical protein C8Q77DRAFT_1056369 [Trametes polyzona]|nr:hypothetical protein C8Q77DRAFT_1056369 [Trametes polyzona]
MTIWRPRGASYDCHDYFAYERRTRELLLQLRGRAAFLKGGIVWRLAVEVLHGGLPDVVTAGPSKDVYSWGQPFRPERGDDYYDDALSSDELDAICGVNKVFTDDSFKQTQDLSWWPKPNIWEKSSLNVGYWTPWCEEWFQAVLKRHLSGNAVLKNSSAWKDALSHFKPAGKLRDAVERASQVFLHDRMCVPSVRL